MSPTVRALAVLVFALGPAVPAVPAATGTQHPFDAHDLVTMARLSEPAVSPDGTRVAFTLRHTDLAADRGRTDLWWVGTDGTGLAQLTTDPASDSSPAWSPDGSSLYFLSTRSGSSQVWRLPVSGGEARQVSDLPVDVATFEISPDGSKLAVSMDTFPDCPGIQCTADRLEAREKSPEDGQIYDRLFVRHWDTWADGRRSHLFVLPADGAKHGAADALDVTRGLDGDVPSKPFGGSEEYTFTPDGKGLVFSSRVVGAEEAWSTDFDLYLVPVDGSAAPRVLTDANQAWDTQPHFSPDGKTLAYLAMKRPRFESDRFRIMLMPWSSDGSADGGPAGPPRDLTEDWDRSPASFLWAPDGKTIYATASNLGNVSLFAVDAGSGEARTLVTHGHVRSPGVAQSQGSKGSPSRQSRRIVFARDTFISPVDLYSVDADGGDERRLTDVDADHLANVRMGSYEQFHFAGWNGDTVYGYVVKPADFEPGKKYPVAFLIHGGPQGSWESEFHYRWNPQPYAGAGYAVVMIDFHGSTGYGQAFTDSISRHWGDRPLEDLQKGLAAAIAQYPFLDGDRVGALGASYGGYMIYWIAGNWPDRFRCLVDHDGVFDTRSAYYSTEELWFPEWELGGPYWKNPELYEKFNPVDYVDKWKTPMLVIHSQHDYRLPLTQGLGAFTALQRQGIPSRLLYYPDESHFVLKPANSQLWYKTVLDWLDRWVKGGESASGAQ
jgi:dipeptidyl aminopeptidase/acylaminoacyl peptidase